MKIKTLHLVISFISVLIVLIVLSWLYPVYELNREVDINSGDVRTRIHVLLVGIKDDIEMTRFSKEVRRLGIDVPQTRVWKPVSTTKTKKFRGEIIDYRYGPAIADCIEVTLWLEVNNVPDQERKEVLQEVLKNLQAEKFDEIKEQEKSLSERVEATGRTY